MSRLILVPQYPTRLRYQEWWWREFPKQLKNYFDEVLVLGRNSGPFITASGDTFAPIAISMQFEAQQIKDYSKLKLRKDDVLLLNDLSFPGLFANVLFHKRPEKCFAICHATSKNAYDYFAKDRRIKYPIEKATAKLFDSVFVATIYHAKKLGWKNIRIFPFPNPPFEGKQRIKEYQVVSVARPGLQKQSKRIEKALAKRGITLIRPECESWKDYYTFLAKSKILLITAKEETYGYQIIDAIKNNCIPIAPNRFSYPELLSEEYLYNDQNIYELIDLMIKIWDENLPVPRLYMQQNADEFYRRISNIMQNE